MQLAVAANVIGVVMTFWPGCRVHGHCAEVQGGRAVRNSDCVFRPYVTRKSLFKLLDDGALREVVAPQHFSYSSDVFLRDVLPAVWNAPVSFRLKSWHPRAHG